MASTVQTYRVIRPDGNIVRDGSLDDLFPFAQREGYCIWGWNPQAGNLVCAYNPNNPEPPTYPNRETVRTIRAGW